LFFHGRLRRQYFHRRRGAIHFDSRPSLPKVHERKADLLDLRDIKGRESAKRGLARELRNRSTQ
jgi:predicted ATPase with chaperone activity